MLVPRLMTALVGIPVLLVALYAGGATYALVVVLVAVLGLAEALRLMRVPVVPETAFLAATGLCAWLAGPLLGQPDLVWPGLAIFGTLLLVRQVVRFPTVTNQDSASVAFAASYAGAPFAHFFLLRGMRHGVALTLMTFLLTWVFDTTAYFAGTRFGRHKMAPAISPGKSWEGSLAGTIATLLFAAAPWPWWTTGMGARVAAAVAVIIFGQLGDLAESAMKRHAQVKDSGHILPGHGGVLDRFDSLMLGVPAVYYLVRLVPAWLGAPLP